MRGSSGPIPSNTPRAARYPVSAPGTFTPVTSPTAGPVRPTAALTPPASTSPSLPGTALQGTWQSAVPGNAQPAAPALTPPAATPAATTPQADATAPASSPDLSSIWSGAGTGDAFNASYFTGLTPDDAAYWAAAGLPPSWYAIGATNFGEVEGVESTPVGHIYVNPATGRDLGGNRVYTINTPGGPYQGYASDVAAYEYYLSHPGEILPGGSYNHPS